MVSYRSTTKVEKNLKRLNKQISIILVENSQDYKIKKEFEKKYKNLKVIIPKVNGGQGYAFNIGARQTKKKFILFMDVDVQINNSQIISMLRMAIKIKKFGVLTPKIKNQSYKNLIIKKDNKNDYQKIIFNTGCIMLVESKIFKIIKCFDQDFFLYYEETDFYKRCRDMGFPVYLLNKVIISNPTSKSIDKEFYHDYLKVRNWHYCWSKFYYYKKHYNYFTALSKTTPNMIRALRKILNCLINFKINETKLYFMEIYGLLCSYFGLRSFYRMK